MLTRIVRSRSTPHAVGIALFVSVFAVVGAAPPYLPVYYESLGLSLGEIGLLAVLAAVSGLIAAPAWGIAADQLMGSRWALVAASLTAMGFAAGLAFAPGPVTVALMAVLFGLAFAGIGPVLDAYALLLVAENQHRYARLRVWGSASFVVSAVIVGFLIEQTELRSLFIVVVGALLVTAALALRLPRRVAVPARPGFAGLRSILANRTLVMFIGTILLVWSAATMVNGFFSIYLIALDAPAFLVGSAWALGAVVEVPLMIAFPALAARFGVERLLTLGAAFMLLRVLLLIVIHDPLPVALSMALHGAGYALLLVGGVTYVGGRAPKGHAATAQGVLAGVVFGLAQAVGPGVAGVIAGATDIATMFTFAAAASLAGGLALLVAVRRPTDVSLLRGSPE